jgi:hypothetical protein
MARRDLPKRFRGYYDQATAQAELQYGGQGDLLAMLLQDTGRDYNRSVKQARRGSRVLQAGIDMGRQSLNDNLAVSGLDAASLPETADARRIQQTQAGALNELDLRGLQAQEYGASGVRQAGEAYREDAGQIRQQLLRLVKDQGLYTNSLLGELIEGDRNARRTARQDAREQSFEAEQKALDRDNQITTSLIGQGFAPDGSILPGGKADPDANGQPGDQGKGGKKKPKLTQNQINGALDAITNARGAYQQFAGQKGFNPSGLRNGLRVGSLPTGDKPIKIPTVKSDLYITAGFELAKGKLSKSTAQKLRARGVKIPKNWLPKGYKPPPGSGTSSGGGGGPHGTGRL